MKLSRITNRAKKIKITYLATTSVCLMITVFCFPTIKQLMKNGLKTDYYKAYIDGTLVGASTDRDELEECIRETRVRLSENNGTMSFTTADINIKTEQRISGVVDTEEEISSMAYDTLRRTVDETQKKAYVVDVGGYVVTLGSLSEVEYLFNEIKEFYNADSNFSAGLDKTDNSGMNTIELNIENVGISAVNPPRVMSGDAKEADVDSDISEDMTNATDQISYGEYTPEEILAKQDGTLNVKFENNAVIVPCYTKKESIDEVNTAIDMVMANQGTSQLSVIVKEKQTYSVPYGKETEYVYNETLYNTEQRVLVEGSEGEKERVAQVTYRNGEEISREIISETVMVEAVARVIEVGTAIPPSYVKPISGGALSSTFGLRWGTLHKGVDWACPIGTSVKASCAGTITQAGWMNGYGYCVTMEHSDGKSTRYAHLSKILVTEGQKVTQNEEIALSGNTGNSTGPHVHFEIIIDGVQVNPFEYLQ